MQSTTPSLNQIAPVTGRMINEESEIHNVVDNYGSLRTIDIDHSSIHDGESFTYSGVGSVVAGDTLYFLGRMGDITTHLHAFYVKADQAPITVELFEAPTVTATGTQETVVNRNRQLLTAPLTEVYTGATVTADGTLLIADIMLGVQKDVNSDELDGHWVLKKNTDYVFKITNGSAQDANIVAGFNWIERD